MSDADHLREISERDQLWASLRALRPEIARLASGDFDASERQQQMIRLIAQVVAAELDYRLREATPE